MECSAARRPNGCVSALCRLDCDLEPCHSLRLQATVASLRSSAETLLPAVELTGGSGERTCPHGARCPHVGCTYVESFNRLTKKAGLLSDLRSSFALTLPLSLRDGTEGEAAKCSSSFGRRGVSTGADDECSR